MSEIKVKVPELAFIRLRSPDLDEAEAFLTDFGLAKVARTPTALYMRGTDGGHHLHVTELGEPKVVGFGYMARDASDLVALAGKGAVESVDEPGGGKRVRLTDPLGFQIEVLADVALLPPLPVVRPSLNLGAHGAKRQGQQFRVDGGPSQVKRIGHVVVHATDLHRTVSWYRETLGMVGTDDVWAGEPDHVIGSFNRVDRGEAFVDHHVLFVVQQKQNGLNHISFEVQDFDDVMSGHQHLRGLGKYQHSWGIGRHFLGSQIFDYWQDPWGRIHEHWTDSDLLNANHPQGSYPVEIGFASQWGDDAPEAFVSHSSR
ncbi:MAG: VOC family protein [Sphingobium sp.]|uniref:VOC family protein n=1 Tax=Sphingobium sp. TaxID=1912891 RepID=UPI0029A202E8|nr:VOC family protein [Sphingobium sp.]MDX3911724.1 VOC family protein [Sphingobium sp.]